MHCDIALLRSVMPFAMNSNLPLVTSVYAQEPWPEHTSPGARLGHTCKQK